MICVSVICKLAPDIQLGLVFSMSIVYTFFFISAGSFEPGVETVGI